MCHVSVMRLKCKCKSLYSNTKRFAPGVLVSGGVGKQCNPFPSALLKYISHHFNTLKALLRHPPYNVANICVVLDPYDVLVFSRGTCNPLACLLAAVA